MDKVIHGIKEMARLHDRHDDPKHPLDIVAQHWSEHCGKTYTGKLLRKAQKISTALWDFTATLQRVNSEQHESDCRLYQHAHDAGEGE